MRTRGRNVGAALAGPLLIVASVLVVLHDFAFRGQITFTQQDVAGYWLPTYCLMGRSLAAGHIPAWNPFSLAGAPFAADPQSGWMYLPVMALFGAFPCDVAIRLYIAMLPILAGLGLYWFLRTEGVSRPAATIGGLVLALAIAGSRLAVNLPFSATLAWTSLLLAAAARYLRSQAWPDRLVWASVTALVWGQLAASHLSHGFILGSGALLAYVLGRTLPDIKAGRRLPREALTLVAVLVPALFLLNLAYFLPRLAYLPRTTLGVGYGGLQELAERLAGRPLTQFRIGPSAAPDWPMVFAISPGPYLGGAPLVLSFAGWWNRRRPLVATFGLFGAVCYLLSLRGVARLLAPVARALPFGDFYLYSPFRFRYALLLALPILAALGFDAWRQATDARRRLLMILPGIVVWGLLPMLVGVPPSRLWLLGVGTLAGGAALMAGVLRSGPALLLPAILAVELVANGLIGQGSSHEFFVTGLGPGPGLRPLTALLEPTIDAASYLRPGPVARAIQAEDRGRYLSLNPARGYLGYQAPGDWAFLTDQRSMLFGIEEAQGYNPVQPIRYWTFIRKVNPDPELHNVSIVQHAPPIPLDLLHVAWTIAPISAPPEPGAVPVAREGEWALYRLDAAPPRATLGDWTVQPAEESLTSVTGPGFDPAEQVILEHNPVGPGFSGSPLRTPSGAGTAAYRWIGAQEARVEVESSGPAVVLIRNSFDPHWRATLDGQPVPILRANYFLQGVAVPGGRHQIHLTYDDPWIGYGLLGSILSLATIIAAALLTHRAQSRTKRSGEIAVAGATPNRRTPAG